MNNYIKNIIEEVFASKAQQRYFYAKSNDKSESPSERKKWKKRAEEFSSKTDFKKIPEKVETKESDIEEIVDEKGNIMRSNIPVTKSAKGASNKTTDQVVKTGAGQMGVYGIQGSRTSLRFWAEADMSKSLGYEKTMGNDEDIEDAKKYFEKELDMDSDEAKERLSQYGYDEKLPDDKVRLVENPKEYVESYLKEVLLKNKTKKDFVSRNGDDETIPPIIEKKIKSLQKTLISNNISIKTLTDYLKNNE